MSGQWYRVETAYFVCAVVVEDNEVVKAAPIMKWAVGKTWPYIRAWIAKKKGKIQEMS
jgi:hypothetical protein